MLQNVFISQWFVIGFVSERNHLYVLWRKNVFKSLLIIK